jgi:hypothetical protein
MRQDNSEAERTDALCRLLGHYLHTADAAQAHSRLARIHRR